MDKAIVSAERIRKLLEYSFITGEFRWRRAGRKGVMAGSVAGAKRSDGYISVLVDGRRYYDHRLVWLWVFGCWPSRGMDHIDGNPSNNSISNLREANQTENMGNRRIGKLNSTGIKNVSRHQGKYRVQIWKNGKAHEFGVFDTIDEAGDVASKARREVYGEFARCS